MPTFKYLAFDKNGRKKEGILEAESISIALGSLKNKGLYPESLEAITEQKKSGFIGLLKESYTRISQRDRTDVFFQLATLINTGIPLTEALGIAAEQSPNKKLESILLQVKDKVNEGVKFSEALTDFENVFSKPYIRMIEIAERTGKLSDILFKISQREEEKSSFNQKIAPVILYPLFVLLIGFGVVIFLLGYVVPKMEKIFSSFHKKLPFITRLLVETGLIVKTYLPAILLFILIVSILSNVAYFKWGAFRKKVDKMFLKIPTYRKMAVAHFISSLSFQLDAFIPLVDAILTSSEAVGNVIFKDRLKNVAEKINEGIPIERAFEESNLFDKMFVSSVATGRKTGRLPDFVRRISTYYEKKIDTTIKTFLAILEPATILILGAIVGFIVMAIMIPLFSINQLVR